MDKVVQNPKLQLIWTLKKGVHHVEEFEIGQSVRGITYTHKDTVLRPTSFNLVGITREQFHGTVLAWLYDQVFPCLEI